MEFNLTDLELDCRMMKKMMNNSYTEDSLVQQTTADYLRDKLGWDSVLAYNHETFGPGGLLGRKNDREVVLTRTLREKLKAFNPGLPENAYDDAIRTITEYSASQSLIQTNREKYALLRDGVQVRYRDENGVTQKPHLKVIDFNDPENNHFLAVRELWVQGDLYHRRADIVGFVNGLPLLFMELKNIHKDIRNAYDGNLADYRVTIPHLFHHNAIILLGNGDKAKIGTLSAKFGHFHEWKRLEEHESGVVDMETLLLGICNKRNFIDLLENFIIFDEPEGAPVKILARNHQFLGVNRAVKAVEERKERRGKLGVFWHTQGSGKSYSMVFFARKIHRRLGSNFTFLICTDREDLDSQIYKTFAGCGLAKKDSRASSGEHLARLLGENKSTIFTLIQKFHKEVSPEEGYSLRDDIIVITDEAHRTQGGTLALNMHDALPNANFIGFTGTPLIQGEDEITKDVFGGYISTYDFKRAVDDGATVPLYYDARGDKLGLSIGDLNERVAAKLEELETDDVNVQQRLEKELKREYHIITAGERLKQVAKDFVEHYSNAWETGKAMFVCIDKITCVRLYDLIDTYWQRRIETLEREIDHAPDEQEETQLKRKLTWMRETKMAVVISEEQGEVEKFKKWDLDILPHRKLIKDGFETEDGERIDVESAFKKAEHPFRIVIVCAMWLTGFDVPSLSNLYLDKPLKAHTLMQAIARANRVHEGKNNGLIVDYCGILKNLRSALATFAGRGDGGRKGDDETNPTKPDEELLAELKEAVAIVRTFLEERGASLTTIIEETGFAKNAAIVAAKEAANENDETRKRFEVACREVFKKFKACSHMNQHEGFRAIRPEKKAIDVIYKSLIADREQADISDIIRQLHEVVDEAIETRPETNGKEQAPYDISKIDFDLLRREFERVKAKKTTVQNLSHAIEQRVQRLLQQNPLRTDLQEHYEKVVASYNSEKDRQTIEATFAALITLVEELTEEESRAMREGLDEESLAIFDLLKKPDLDAKGIKTIKQVAVELLQTLKAEKLKIEHWRERENTRDAVKSLIGNFLYSDQTGLPADWYSEDDVETKTEEVFRHVFRAYPTAESPYFSA